MPWILLPDHSLKEVGPDEWAYWFEFAGEKRIVKQDHIGPWFVSTLFFGLDMNWARMANPKLPPHLLETASFCDGEDSMLMRCATWDEAVAQHEFVCDQVRQSMLQKGEGGNAHRDAN